VLPPTNTSDLLVISPQQPAVAAADPAAHPQNYFSQPLNNMGCFCQMFRPLLNSRIARCEIPRLEKNDCTSQSTKPKLRALQLIFYSYTGK
jgi:hypothetical protein